MKKIHLIPTTDIKTGRSLPDLYCPFGVRDLKSDVCYSGNGVNRCQWFRKYKQYSTGEISPHGFVNFYMFYIVCTCPFPRNNTQLTINFDF